MNSSITNWGKWPIGSRHGNCGHGLPEGAGGNSQWIVCSGFRVSWHTPLLLLSLCPPLSSAGGICNLKSPREIPRIFAFLFLLLSSCSPEKYCMFWFQSIDVGTFDVPLRFWCAVPSLRNDYHKDSDLAKQYIIKEYTYKSYNKLHRKKNLECITY